ncbi:MULTISPECIES: glutamate 5-kinase [Aerococcus]|uniref:glutamate 5-kinase n=1 Tax=Aerococcus urinae (strain CCUG 59500 / ACS-120-V-Col10a) TaxID=2976812 RepID=UPI000200F228|nr:glutamate 5-kinase [Aerococcus sp. Group 1]AEA01830.1 glutamate 5-kinase [Aerococcus sp. Group 1]MCY3030112.1 glutamate 5-kinase [Aerococcus sp. Group 1]MCY3054425.1 glutamate 5-kinase [Aerococcus sp. Group 1]MCY3056155.1 glutamate 5-kinase [Aerococcus sp. Group 1]MCY3061090.1 glutamate 5-kinase [Aerococcus sp. Group 1]
MHRDSLKDAKRIVIKVGTNSLMTSTNNIRYQRIDRLAYVISSLAQSGKEVILVSSGAMGVGCAQLNLPKRPKNIPDQQAVAAVGQVALMNTYARFFSYYHKSVAQILMTRDVIDFHDSLANLKNNFASLLKHQIIPIVNENDAIAVDEMDHKVRFGDNDNLSALVASIVEADLLILLTDVDGFYDANPNTDPQAKRFSTIHEVNADYLAMAGDKGSTFSTGGMHSKLKAAAKTLEEGRRLVIMSSEEPSQIFDLLAGADIGTAFIPKNES